MTNIKLIEADGEGSIYLTDYGELRVRDVHLTRGETPNYLPVGEMWDAFESALSAVLFPPVRNPQELFTSYMQVLGATDGIMFCPSCDRPDWDDDLDNETKYDGSVCEGCADSKYTACGCCEKLVTNRSMNSSGTSTLGDDRVCCDCSDSYYRYCDECEGYYHEDDSDDHDHEEEDMSSGCCDSPQPEFRVRNGSEMLANDTRAEVALPSRIDNEGIDTIKRLLVTEGYRDLAWYGMGELDHTWQTKSGNYPKRLSKLGYDRYRFKLSPEVMSKVGVIARDHSKAASLDIEVTRDLNQGAYAFYHEDSCWWQSYYQSRCALKTNGGFGLRSFSGTYVTGRAWVMPLKQTPRGLQPTFNTETPDAFIVFNGYGELSGYTAPRIVAQMAGLTYAKLGFSCEPMYVNSGGYLVAPEETVRQFNSDRGLSLSLDRHAGLYEDEAADRALAENAAKCHVALSEDNNGRELSHAA